MKFLFVDQINAFEGSRIVGEKRLRPDEPYLAWHFPEAPILPGNLIVEAATQLAGWLVAANSGFSSWLLLTAVERARFFRFVRPGEAVLIEVVCEGLDDVDDEGIKYTFVAHVGDDECASAQCTGQRVPLADLDDPEDVRRAFDALSAEGQTA